MPYNKQTQKVLDKYFKNSIQDLLVIPDSSAPLVNNVDMFKSKRIPRIQRLQLNQEDYLTKQKQDYFNRGGKITRL